MAVLDPVKVVIDNYPEGQTEYLDVVNNLENETLGSRKIPFSRELYIERKTSWRSHRKSISACSRAMSAPDECIFCDLQQL